MQPFSPRLEWLNQKLILAGTGGLLTMLAQSGSGTLAGSAHMETFRQIARAEAMDISEELNRQFDLPVLREAGALQPGQRPLAYFSLAANERADAGTVVDHAAKLKQAGLDMDPSQLTDLSGYKVTRAAQPSAFPSLANRETQEPGPDPLRRVLDAAAAKILDGSIPFERAVSEAMAELDRLPALAGSVDYAGFQKKLEQSLFEAAAAGAKEKALK